MTVTENAAQARECVVSGTPPLLMICSNSAASLSASSREFVRELRSGGARVEFHAPGDAEALLQSTNRLLADIPLEALLESAARYPPHLLIIDDAESLSAAEAASLRRIVHGLRGSSLRTVLLARSTRAGLQHLPISEVTDLAMIWDLDGAVLSEAQSPPVFAEPIIAAVSLPEPTREDAPKAPESMCADEPMPDVLAELARERAETRGFDVTMSRRWMATPVKVAMAVVALILVGYAVQTILMGPPKSAPLVYDCGLHADRESIDVLIARIGRTTPMQVTTEGGRFRLQVGPFASESAAASVRAQVWLLGACRVEPIVARSITAPPRKVGG